GSSLIVTGGGRLALPAVTTLSGAGGSFTTLEATDPNSVLDLSTITSYTGANLDVSADGPGSLVDLSNLTSLLAGGGDFRTDRGGVIRLSPSITSLSGSSLTVDSAAGLPLDQFTSLTNGTIAINGGSFTLSHLTDIDGSSLEVSNGGQLAVPNV